MSFRIPLVLLLLSAAGPARIVEMSTDGGYRCARFDDGRVKCWGQNDRNQCGFDGDGRNPAANPFVDLKDREAVSLSSGWSKSCAILNDDTIRCWGDDTGVGTTLRLPRGKPVEIARARYALSDRGEVWDIR